MASLAFGLDHLRVNVTGDVDGDTLNVSSIKLL